MNDIQCPRCKHQVREGDIACSFCRLVVIYFCEHCNEPVPITKRYCTKCGNINPNFVPDFRGESSECEPNIDKEFDDESLQIAREIEELKRACTEGSSNRTNSKMNDNQDELDNSDAAQLYISSLPVSSVELEEKKSTESVITYWNGEFLCYSKNKKEPIHIGLGTNPKDAAGVPGLILITNHRLLFFSYLPKFQGIDGVFAYFSGNISRMEKMNLNPNLLENKIIFDNHGVFKAKFKATKQLHVHFGWSNEPTAGSVENQIYTFKALIERIKLFSEDRPMLSGDYFFSTSKQFQDPEIQDIFMELNNVPQVKGLILANLDL